MPHHGDHTAACLKELSLKGQSLKLLASEKIPQSNLNINKTGIFAIHFYFLYFFDVSDDPSTFFKGRIRFLGRSNRLRIDTVTLLTEWKSTLRIADE